MERASPALAALFSRLTPDGRHAILDLGPATTKHLALLSGYARRIRFTGLLPDGLPDGAEDEDGREPQPEDLSRVAEESLYDVILAWDVLDRLPEARRASLVNRLATAARPGALLYAFVRSEGQTVGPALHSTLVDVNRVAQEEVGPAETKRPVLLPAHVEKVLAPFEVVQAFSLRIGQREYLMRRR